LQTLNTEGLQLDLSSIDTAVDLSGLQAALDQISQSFTDTTTTAQEQVTLIQESLTQLTGDSEGAQKAVDDAMANAEDGLEARYNE
jgi:N-acetylglutamate synthase/N-acetylornithine aminotransferase